MEKIASRSILKDTSSHSSIRQLSRPRRESHRNLINVCLDIDQISAHSRSPRILLARKLSHQERDSIQLQGLFVSLRQPNSCVCLLSSFAQFVRCREHIHKLHVCGYRVNIYFPRSLNGHKASALPRPWVSFTLACSMYARRGTVRCPALSRRQESDTTVRLKSDSLSKSSSDKPACKFRDRRDQKRDTLQAAT